MKSQNNIFCVFFQASTKEEVNTVKKTRILKLVAALLVTVSVMATPAMQAEAAGCGNWVCDKVGEPYCEKKGCGIFWYKKEVHYQRMYYKRSCVENDNSIWTEHRSELKYLGCC